jgi:hypothetical protein
VQAVAVKMRALAAATTASFVVGRTGLRKCVSGAGDPESFLRSVVVADRSVIMPKGTLSMLKVSVNTWIEVH